MTPSLRRWLLCAAALSLVPFLWLAMYAHPVADDYCYAAKSAGQSLWAWSRSEWLYWNGRYASNLLMAHGPLSGHGPFLPGYRLVPPALMALTWAGIWCLLRRATQRQLPNGHAALGALVLLALYMNIMPDAGEGFYWYTGAVTYQLGSILLLFHLALLTPQGGKPSMLRLFCSLLLAVAIVGMSEIHMLLMLCLHTALLAFALHRRQRVLAALLLLAATTAGAALMYMAPGNAVRGAMFAGTHELGRSLGMSFLQALRFSAKWLLSPALLSAGLLYLPLHRWLRSNVPGFARLLGMPWWLAALVPFLLIMATTFPAYWNTGLLGQHRTINVAALFFIPMALFNLALWIERSPRSAYWTAMNGKWAVALAFLAFNLTGNGLAAYRDLLDGRAAAYDRELAAREAMVKLAADEPGTVVQFRQLAAPPRILTSYELRGPLQDWMLNCQARYFGAEEQQVRNVP